ncbi:glycosyltransferase family 4 protein [Aeribacillus composti]|uniref:glycosyltransferase family 4 protein n=1 Tax=Aeribacillus composti TaxID=1868734 RepID=UPI00406A4AE7
MKIIYITQHFPPEIGAAPARAYDLSYYLGKLGHNVTIITAFPNHETNFGIFKKETMDHVNVYRMFRMKDTKQSALRRLMNYFSFTFSSFIGGIFVQKPDIVYATTPQLFQTFSGWLLSKWHRAKFVLEVRDLWVDFAEILGQFKNKKLLNLARKLEKFLYKKADLIVVVTNGYKDRLVSEGIPEEKIIVIPNGVNPALLNDTYANYKDIKTECNLQNKRVILYSGNIGSAQGLETVIQAAIKLKDNSDYIFLFIGEGVEKKRLKELAEQNQLSNVRFIDQIPKDELISYYKAADIGIVSLKKHPLFSITIPSKMFDYLSMSIPVLIGVDGEARQIIEKLNGGYFFEPENADDFIRALFNAFENEAELKRMRKNLKERLLAHYNREMFAKKLSDHIELLHKKKERGNA